MNAYLSNVVNALQGKASESFQNGETASENGTVLGGGVVFGLLFSLLPLLLFAYGAAKLSWCLNHSYGWSFLCFLFPGFYYPYYALFLNPLCTTPMVGGKRR